MIKRMHKLLSLALVMLIMLTCTGCWDRKEINDISVATAIGFDQVMDGGQPKILFTTISLKIPSTGGAGGAGTSQPGSFGQVESAEGETVYDAVRNIGLRSPRQLVQSHVLVIVIGESMARQGIAQVIDYLHRHRDIRLRTYIVVADGSALDALQSQPEFEMLNATEISKMLEVGRVFLSKTVSADLFQALYGLLTPGQDVAMPRLCLFVPPEKGSAIRHGPPVGSNEAGGHAEKQNGIAGVEQVAHPESQTIGIDGTAVFSGDRMSGWLNGKESQGVLFITGRAVGGAIPFAFRSPDKNATFIFRHLRTSVKPVIATDGITFEVRITGTGTLAEEKNANIDVMKEDDVKTAQQLIDREVEHYCQEALDKCQALQSDAFGFGDLIYKSDPAAWKQIGNRWKEIFPTVRLQTAADFRITQAGLASYPIPPQKSNLSSLFRRFYASLSGSEDDPSDLTPEATPLDKPR